MNSLNILPLYLFGFIWVLSGLFLQPKGMHFMWTWSVCDDIIIISPWRVKELSQR